MRLLIRLKNQDKSFTNDDKINTNYYIQSFIYNLLKNTDFHLVHNYEKSRTRTPSFCYSNLFSSTNERTENIRKLIISSPNEELIELLYQKLSKLDFVYLGKEPYKILEYDIFTLNYRDVKHILTSTPVIIRIPRSKLEDYSININKQYQYIYWRQSFPLEIFLKQLENNLRRKFYNYYGIHTNSSLNFEWFVFKKQVSTRLLIHKTSHIIIGTVWEFFVDQAKDKELFNFGIDAGFGERNTMGFGFINPI